MNLNDPVAADVESSPNNWWMRAFLGVALLLPAPIAAALVLGTAVDSSHQVDALWPAALTFVIWLSVPAAYGAVLLLQQSASRRVAVALIAVVASFGSTLWIVRPQAPTGEAYQESLSGARATLGDDLVAMLDEVTPGRARVISDERSSDCTDTFGRDRGAAVGVVDFEIDGGLSLDELDTMVEALRAAGWSAHVVDVSFSGGPGRRVEADLNGYHFKTWGTFIEPGDGQPTSAEASTPCLRR